MSDASEIAELRAALAASEARADAATRELLHVRATVSCSEAMIKELKLEIAKLRRDKYGKSSERSARLLDQLELQLEELEAAATEDALAAEQADAGDGSTVRSFTRRKPNRKPFPEHLPRERVVVLAPTHCDLRLLRVGPDRKDGRGCHRHIGSRSAPVEGDPDSQGKVHLPLLRKNQPTARSIPRHSTPSHAAGQGPV